VVGADLVRENSTAGWLADKPNEHIAFLFCRKLAGYFFRLKKVPALITHSE